MKRFPSQLLIGPVVVAILGSAPEVQSQPDSAKSFFVPQAGSVLTPIEGMSSPTPSFAFFRACPNNDGGSSLPNNARIKVVVHNSLGIPIPGIAAADICVLLNGGTPIQGFSGAGADSIIANGTWNVAPLCPDVKCIEADAPTDLLGTTYITFTGPTPGMPGVGTRSSARKWGHFDSDTPVVVMGTRIGGRLTTASATPYILRIKNFDLAGGLTAVLDQGEVVNTPDFNVLTIQCFSGLCGTPAGSPMCYWCDFDSNNAMTTVDFNAFLTHYSHDCDTPLSP
jgi:hypothetical protein